MNRYNFRALGFEITRKCNKKCPICLRGEAQDCTITPGIIDKVFEEVEDCKYISILGGESLLELDMLEYLIDKIVSSNWNIEFFNLTTNGSIIDERIIIALEKLCENKSNCKALMRVSADRFHNIEDSTLAYTTYSSLVKNERVSIQLKDTLDVLKCSGYGRQYIADNPDEKMDDVLCIQMSYINKHRIKVKNNEVFCSLLVLANGNIAFNEEVSYQELDELSIGNLYAEPIKEMIKRNNDECLLSCCDWDNIRCIKMYLSGCNRVYANNYKFDMHYVVAEHIFNKIYELRKLARDLYPYVPVQDIITNILMPKDYIFDVKDEVTNICQNVLPIAINMEKPKWLRWLNATDSEIFNLYINNLHRHTDNAQINYTAYLLLLHPEIIVESILQSIHQTTKFYRLITTSDIKNTPEFKKLDSLNEKYRLGILSATNDKVLPCEIGESTIEGEFNRYDAAYHYLLNRERENGFLGIGRNVVVLSD